MSQILNNANQGYPTHLSLFLGSTFEEQIESLQKIKDSMVEVFIKNRADDNSVYDASTVDLMEQFYFEADIMVKQLLENKFVS